MLKLKNIYLFVIILLLLSCFDTKDNNKPKDSRYGGVFIVETSVSFQNKFAKSWLTPYKIGETSYAQIFRSVYETLTFINPNTCELAPGIAKEWKVNEDATEFTFILNSNIFFHKNQTNNKALTATDVKNSFDELSIALNKSVAYSKVKDLIQGVVQYSESVDKGQPLAGGVSGVEVINDSTIKFKLLKSYTPFPEVISNIDFSIFRRCSIDDCTVGTGPFVYDTVYNESLFLSRHSNYWKFEGDVQLPFLDTLIFKRNINLTIEERLNQFINNEVHLLKGINTSDISSVMKVLREDNDIDFAYQSIDDARLTALSFNNLIAPFNDVNVRKAFSYAFDRNLFVDSVLNGEQWAANNGLAPQELAQYEKPLKGYEYNLAKAKELLAKAGYPNGKGFPVIELSVVSGNHEYGDKVSKTEKVVMDMICKNLNISYKLKEYKTFYVMFEDLWSGKSMVSIYNYTSRYPNPESYLNVFNLKIDSSEHIEHDNTMFFRDTIFDLYYGKALNEVDVQKQNELFYKAETRIIELAPLIPIFHGEANRITSKGITGLSEINNLGIVDYSKVYLLKKAK